MVRSLSSVIVLLSCLCAGGQAIAKGDIAAAGTTTIASVLGGTRISATYHTMTVPGHSVHDCTGGRDLCSPVMALELSVGGVAVSVPEAVVASLADVNRAALESHGWSQYVLVAYCGDGGASSAVRILFDRQRVLEREVVANEAGLVAERTYYEDLSGAFR